LAEVLSLHFGRKLFNFLDGTSFASDIDDAIERLEPAISRSHQDLARELDVKFLAVTEHAKDYRGDASEIIDEAITALVYQAPLDARYRKASGVESTYVLHPYTLATFRQGLYLFARDVRANLVKTFALERFTDLARRRGERFHLPTSWRPDAYIAHAFGIISGPPQDVVIAFRERVGAYIRERTWHPTQTFRTLPDGQLELRMSVAVTVELRTWVQGFGPDAVVVSPPQLVEQVSQALHAAAERYQ
jgi:proteasome accessory factor B